MGTSAHRYVAQVAASVAVLALGGCDGVSWLKGGQFAASSQTYEAVVSNVASAKTGETAYEYIKQTSVQWGTTARVEVTSEQDPAPSGQLLLVGVETAGLLEEGTRPTFFSADVIDGIGKIEIRNSESYPTDKAPTSGVPKYEFRRALFRPYKRFDAVEKTVQTNSKGAAVFFSASPQTVTQSLSGDSYAGLVDIQAKGLGELSDATLLFFVAKETIRSDTPEDVGRTFIVSLPLINGELSIVDESYMGIATSVDGTTKAKPGPSEFKWRVLGYESPTAKVNLTVKQ